MIYSHIPHHKHFTALLLLISVLYSPSPLQWQQLWIGTCKQRLHYEKACPYGLLIRYCKNVHSHIHCLFEHLYYVRHPRLNHWSGDMLRSYRVNRCEQIRQHFDSVGCAWNLAVVKRQWLTQFKPLGLTLRMLISSRPAVLLVW